MSSQEISPDVDLDTLNALPATTFAAQVHPLLSSLAARIFALPARSPVRPYPEVVAITARATEPQTVAAIAAVLTPPYADRTAHNIAWLAFDEILENLPLLTLERYRETLSRLSTLEPPANTVAGTNSDTGHCWVAASATALLHFMDDPTAVWVPKSKSDSLAIRSLSERVTTSAEMQPHIPGLLEWLGDANWPPYTSCRQQLARFPEVAVGPARR
ncbi:hypothetical protein TWF696_005428 [Orbilia brochopaga]|uniref:DUF5071 domain-containing protein n=1 Tax=Orbilia brochopaga TaxID=3140254 RepID=A0AAV9V218_9PEZI